MKNGKALPIQQKNFGSNMMNKLKDGVLESFKNVQHAISSTVDWLKKKLGFSKDTENKSNKQNRMLQISQTMQETTYRILTNGQAATQEMAVSLNQKVYSTVANT